MKDLALVQHLHGATRTSISQTTIMQTAKVPHQQDCLDVSQQLLLRVCKMVGPLEKG